MTRIGGLFNKKTLIVFTSLCGSFFLMKYLWPCFIYRMLLLLCATYHAEDWKNKEFLYLVKNIAFKTNSWCVSEIDKEHNKLWYLLIFLKKYRFISIFLAFNKGAICMWRAGDNSNCNEQMLHTLVF